MNVPLGGTLSSPCRHPQGLEHSLARRRAPVNMGVLILTQHRRQVSWRRRGLEGGRGLTEGAAQELSISAFTSYKEHSGVIPVSTAGARGRELNLTAVFPPIQQAVTPSAPDRGRGPQTR